MTKGENSGCCSGLVSCQRSTPLERTEITYMKANSSSNAVRCFCKQYYNSGVKGGKCVGMHYLCPLKEIIKHHKVNANMAIFSFWDITVVPVKVCCMQ